MSANPYESMIKKNPYAGLGKFVRQADALDNPNMAADGLTPLEAGLAGAGKRLRDIFTLGLAEGEHDKALMQRPAAQVGSAVTDIAGFALPLTKGAQGVSSVLSRALPKVGPVAATIAGNAGVSGVFEGLTRPGTVGERAVSAGTAAITSGAIDGVFQVGSKFAKGPLSATNVTPEAKLLIDDGIPVPPWKASDSARTRDFAERAKASWLGKPIINDAERRAFLEWNKKLVKEATPPVPVLDDAGSILRWDSNPVSKVGADTLNTLKSRFDDAYGALYKGRVIPIDDGFKSEIASTLQATERYYPHLAPEVKGIADKVGDILSSTNSKTVTSALVDASGQNITKQQLGHAGATPGAVRSAIDAVDDAIKNAWRQGNGEKAEALSGLKDALVSARVRGLPPEVQSQAASINKAYTNFLQLQRAMSSVSAQKAGLTTPQQLLNSIKAGDRSAGKAAFSRGNMPNQAEAINAARVLGSTLPEVGPGTAEKLRLAAIMSSPFALMGDFATALGAASLATPAGQRFMFGQFPIQGALSEAIQTSAPYAAQGGALLNTNLRKAGVY